MATDPLIDFAFLDELSGGDSKYKYEVLNIFLSTTPDGMANLERLVKEGSDFEALYKQAHALKSSVSIIKIRGMYDGLASVEALGRQIHEQKAPEKDEESKEQLNATFNEVLATFNEAHPELIKVRDENKSAE